MKSKIEIEDLRQKDKKELFGRLKDSQHKLTELRMGQTFRKLKNFHEITATKKRIARIWTILSEKILEEQIKEKV